MQRLTWKAHQKHIKLQQSKATNSSTIAQPKENIYIILLYHFKTRTAEDADTLQHDE